MNARFVFNQFGLLLLGFAAIMVGLAGAYFGVEWVLGHEVSATARIALLISAAVGGLAGGTLWLSTRRGPKILGRREALLLVAMSWVAGAAFAALPFWVGGQLDPGHGSGHPFRHFADCYFEAMSGLTTTGATVLPEIESLPRSLLLWRALTQWLGGLGIVVLFVAVLPSVGVGGKKLYRVEAPGPAVSGLQPQIRDTARVLWYIYLGLTLIEITALRIAGMSWFDALCHTFTTLATGGFSTMNASIGAYGGLAIRIILIVFMILAGMNFGLFYHLIRGRLKLVLGDVEARFYLGLLLVGSGLVFVSLLGAPLRSTSGAAIDPGPGTALREAVFTTVSIHTTTGFCTSDFNEWPFLAHAVLVTLMLVGGSAGSTAGGIKVIRVWIALKVMLGEIERVFRPQVVRTLRVSGGTIDPELKLAAVSYALGIIIIAVAGGAAIMLLEGPRAGACDYTTATTASIACLCTIGPGLGGVGAVENYGWFGAPAKFLMSLLMAVGRLEVFAIIVLFTPRFWRRD